MRLFTASSEMITHFTFACPMTSRPKRVSPDWPEASLKNSFPLMP